MLMPKNAYGAEMILQKQAGKGSSKHTFQFSYCCISVWKLWQTWPMKTEINDQSVESFLSWTHEDEKK